MPRTSRIVIPGCPHHGTQRGNNRQAVFVVVEDRRFYLETLREQCERFGLARGAAEGAGRGDSGAAASLEQSRPTVGQRHVSEQAGGAAEPAVAS